MRNSGYGNLSKSPFLVPNHQSQCNHCSHLINFLYLRLMGSGSNQEAVDIVHNSPRNGQEQELPGAISTVEVLHENIVIEFSVDQKQLEPQLEMEFDSLESAKQFYYEYAERNGFCARSGKCSTSLRDDSVFMKQFICYKEGFSAKK